MLPETATFDGSLSSTAREAAETWVTAPVTPNSPSMRVERTPGSKRSTASCVTLAVLVFALLVGSMCCRDPGGVQLHVRLPVPVPNLQRPSVLVVAQLLH